MTENSYQIKLKRIWIAVLAVLTMLLVVGPAMVVGYAQTTSHQPNIIFIFADDLGWGDLGSYGNSSVETPHLDKLAQEGSLFTNFYVNSPVCSPSRAAVMTGQFPSRNRIFAHFAGAANARRNMPNYLDPAVPTITSILKEAGYATGHFGKWHLGRKSPTAYGVDEYLTKSDLPNQEDPHFRNKSTEYIVDASIDFIKRHKNQPFYLNVWALLTHATLNPTEEQLQPFKKFGPRGVPYQGTKQIYYASLTALDSAIGRLLGYLEENNLAKETLVIFSSDNGPERLAARQASHSAAGSAGPFRGRKRSLYEGGIRVPFIVRWPGHITAGEVDSSSVVSAVDLLPTLTDLAGAEIPATHELDGENISQILRGTPEPRDKPLFWNFGFTGGEPMDMSPNSAVLEGPWKLLMNSDGSRVELYHIPTDPMEMDNRAEEHPDIVSKLKKKLRKWEATLPESPVHTRGGQQHLNQWEGISQSNN